jgi:hypothetical protein
MDWFNADNLNRGVRKYYLTLIVFIASLVAALCTLALRTPDPTVTSINVPTETCDTTSTWREVQNVEFFGFAVTATSGPTKKQGDPLQWVAFNGAAQRASLWITIDNVQCVRLVDITERGPEVEFYQKPTRDEINRLTGNRITPQSNTIIMVPAGTRAMSVSTPEGGQTRITRIEVSP